MSPAAAASALDNALLVEDAYREQYNAARARMEAAPAGQRGTAGILLRHAGDQLSAAIRTTQKARQLLHESNPTNQQELPL